MDLGLKGKKALVTGASRGLGYATAYQLALEGASVVVNSRSTENVLHAADTLIKETGAQVFGVAGDLQDADTPAKVVAEAVAGLGGLDILITNTAGPPAGAFESFDEATWAKAIDLSFLSHVRLIRAALPALRESAAASVLTITSYSVKQPIPNLVLSNSIRVATIGLTKSLALELGNEGIRFNSILPGWTKTERVDELMENRAKASGATVAQEFAKQAIHTALGHMATPDEIAKPAAFLVSPAASYITGVMLLVDGGVTKATL